MIPRHRSVRRNMANDSRSSDWLFSLAAGKKKPIVSFAIGPTPPDIVFVYYRNCLWVLDDFINSYVLPYHTLKLLTCNYWV